MIKLTVVGLIGTLLYHIIVSSTGLTLCQKLFQTLHIYQLICFSQMPYGETLFRNPNFIGRETEGQGYLPIITVNK